MKDKPKYFRICHLIGLAFGAMATMAAAPSSQNDSASLGLLRLKGEDKSNEGAPLAVNKFSIDDLAPANAASGGANKAKKDNVDYIALEAGKQWSQTLRGSPKDPTFASFMIYGSQTTIIEVGGARLGVTASPINSSLQLMFDDSTTGTLQWKSLNVHVGTGTYSGKTMAALPVLTIHIDPSSGLWHLYSGSRLLADHLPLIAEKKDSRQFTVTAGNDGAWICGLVLSDENPLYEDANNNGIDDAFEKQQRGGVLLSTTASISERQQLAQQWKAAQRTKAPPALFVTRPLPDVR
jgi:hypothetical protein